METALRAGTLILDESSAGRATSVRWWLVAWIAAVAVAAATHGSPGGGVGGPMLLGGGPPSSAGSGSGSSASPAAAAASPQDAGCDTLNVQELVGRAEREFDAGLPVAALAVINRALVCKQDVAMYRSAALYACAARNAASAQWYYQRIPRHDRPAVEQRCLQERIALLAPSAGSSAGSPAPQPAAPAPPSPPVSTATAPPVACATTSVSDLLARAAMQSNAGLARPALVLVSRALVCQQDPRMYQLATLYACAANDAVRARTYYVHVLPQDQPALGQRCAQQGILLGAAARGSPNPQLTAVQLRAQLVSIAPSPNGPGCGKQIIEDLMYEAADQFIAGNAKSALATVVAALVCKQDVSMIRMAALYACVAHDGSAQHYYSKLPRQLRPAVQQRCLQENIALRDTPAEASNGNAQQVSSPSPSPSPLPYVPSSSSLSGQVPCATMSINIVAVEAQTRFTAGYPRSALSLIVNALTCQRDPQLYQLATMYACSAHDQASARRYFPNAPAAAQPPLIQKCQQEGLTLP